ncbi:MAG: trypsin-like serine protease [Actinomycetota bacterium]
MGEKKRISSEMNWRIFFIFILLALIFLGCRQSKYETIKVEKDSQVTREIFDVKKYPALTAVGKINFIGQRWCSLVLVSEDIAVSAGHCFLGNNLKFDLSKDFEPFWTVVIFRENGVKKIENVSVKRVLKAEMNPDYAIVRLNRKITGIKPLKVSILTLDEMRANEANLGCAGFNGDKELGDDGWTMTISRNIKIVPETNSKSRVDATCISTYGGSGGLFFEERTNAETNLKEYDFIGVVWGVTDEKYNEQGKLVKDENVVTSITPVSTFFKALNEIIGEK